MNPSKQEGHTVDTTLDPDVPVLIARGTIASVEVAGVWLHVRLEVPVVVLVDCARNRRPRCLEAQNALNAVTLELLARLRVQDDGLDTEERHRCATRLRLDGSGERRHDDRASLSLPERVDDGALLAADMVVVPVPRFRVDRLADTTEDTKRAQIVILHVVLTEAAEETDGSGRRVELGNLVLVDGLPVPCGGRVDGRRLEDGSRHTVCERTVYDVGMSGDPSNVGHASEAVVWVHVKDVLDGQSRPEEVATGGVDDTLRFSSRAGSLY